MKKILALLIACILFACSPGERVYEGGGIGFSYPGEWSVTEQYGGYGEDFTAVSVKKDGVNSSGLVTVTLFGSGEDVTADMLIAGFFDSIERDAAVNDLTYYAAAPGEYGGYPARSAEYVFTSLGVPHSGRVYAVEAGDRLAFVCVQGADEDVRANRAGFATIESTFRLK